MHFRFGQQAAIKRFDHPIFQRCTHRRAPRRMSPACQPGSRSRRDRLQIEQLFNRLGLPEFRLSLIQLARIEQLFPNSRRRSLEHVFDVLQVRVDPG